MLAAAPSAGIGDSDLASALVSTLVSTLASTLVSTLASAVTLASASTLWVLCLCYNYMASTSLNDRVTISAATISVLEIYIDLIYYYSYLGN